MSAEGAKGPKANLDARLVFGLTLAELLLLTLLLLLLGLAGLLHYSVGQAEAAKSPVAALNAGATDPGEASGPREASAPPGPGGASPTRNAVDPSLPPSASNTAPAGAAGERALGDQLRNTALEGVLREARRENQALRASVAELNRFKELADAAAKINPALPAPAVLGEGLRALEAVGTTSDPARLIAQWKGDSDARRATQSELRDYQRLLEAASRADPDSPPAETLKRALSHLEAAEDTTNAIRPGRASRSDRDDGASASSQAEGSRALAANSASSDGSADGGRGNRTGNPPCWINAQGETDYLFEITLKDNFVTLRDLAPAARAGDPGFRLSRPLLRKGNLEEEEFKKAMAPLFRTSISQGCRYVVQMRDSTGPTSKDAYKTWRSLIEGYFFVKPVT